jgi:multiple sugar transport system permease protein
MKKSSMLPYMLLLPTITIIVFIDMIPGVYAIFLSLFDIQYFRKGDFFGLGNYFKFAADKFAVGSIFLTLHFSLALILLNFLLGLAFALVAQRLRTHGRTLIGIILVPWVTSKIISSLLIKWLLAPYPGSFFYSFAQLFQLEGINLLAYPQSAYATLLAVETWEHIGFAVITLYAGLSAIPEELYEASRVDGAKYHQQLAKIVLPLLIPSILVTLSMLTLFFLMK